MEELCEKVGDCTEPATRFSTSYGNLCEKCFAHLKFVCNRKDDLLIRSFMNGSLDYLLDPDYESDWSDQIEETFFTKAVEYGHDARHYNSP